MIPSLLAASDVLGTGWFAAHAADVAPGKTVALVGDAAVGCSASSATQMGAERLILMSRHADRQKLGPEFGATDVVTSAATRGGAHQGHDRPAGRPLR